MRLNDRNDHDRRLAGPAPAGPARLATLFAVLLGASVLLNVALLARTPDAPPPAREKRTAPRIAREEVVADPEVLVLRERVRELETRPTKVVELPAPPPRVSGFRDKLPRALKLSRDGRAMASASPEALLELQEVTFEFQKAKLNRWKDPRGYVDCLRVLLEQIRSPLSPDAVRALEDYEASFAGMSDADAWTRYLHELGTEADELQKLRPFVTPEQEARVMAFGAFSPWSASTAPWIERQQAEPHLVQQWMSAYALDESQKQAVAAAARLYLNGANALNAQMGAAAVPGRDTAEWRRRSGQILIDALGSLESSLPPEQRERLRQRRPSEVRVYDAFAAQRWAR